MMKNIPRRPGASLRILALTSLVTLLSAASFTTALGAPPNQTGPTPTAGAASTSSTSAPAAPSATGILSAVSLAQTSAGMNNVVYNGEPITYTFSIFNTGTVTATNVKVYDSLPANTFAQINCTPECSRIVMTDTVANPIGGFIQVTQTAMITWLVSAIPPSPEFRVLTFTTEVIGQADGTVFSNGAYFSYDQGSPFQGATIQTTVRQRILNTGSASLPSVPTWFSTETGGTLDSAWGDYDHSGVPSLALASTIGTSVYHNDGGTLRRVFNISNQSYGATWADVDGDGYLELVVVGASVDGSSQSPGINYIYHYSPTLATFTQFSQFSSPLQLARIAAADLDGDGHVDLIGSTNAINTHGIPTVYYWDNDGTGTFTGVTPVGIAYQATAAIGLGDVNNDGLPDLVLGQFPNGIALRMNTSVSDTISFAIPQSIDRSISFLPYGFRFGDYDRDGYLDLAAAFPLQREARIYHNQLGSGFSLSRTIRTNEFWTPLSVDWVDMTGDGSLDLVVSDSPPKVYQFSAATNSFQFLSSMTSGAIYGQIWNMRGIQSRPYQGPSLSLADRDQPSMMFDAVVPNLKTTVTHVDPAGNPFPASTVALGDLRSSGMLDLLFGASNGSLGTRQYLNQDGTFPSLSNINTPLGPESIAVGDMLGDGKLEYAVGSAVDVRIYAANGTQLTQLIPDSGGPYTVAWGDINGDGLLDLLVGSNGPVYAYLNQGGTLSTTPVWTSTETCQSTSLAWADYDRDNWLDFAVGCADSPVRLYHNTSLNSFDLAWTAPISSHATSVAWADYNADGWPDLAVGSLGAPVVLYENAAGQFGTPGLTPVWSSPTISQTTAIAWGDWNNDGYPDLAVANSGDSVQVFGNFDSRPAQPRLFWVWTSAEKSNWTGVAWGDMNGSGYQDLVVSSADNNMNGVYRNGTVIPSQYTSVYTPTLLLPHVGPYVTVHRPGMTNDAFLLSSSELVGSRSEPTVTVRYEVYAPDSTRVATTTLIPEPITTIHFEYSLTGGASWLTATPAISSPLPITEATRLGTPGIFIWDAVADKAISDDALFRVTAVKAESTGPVQRTEGSAVSPPFRARATTCDWPAQPTFTVDNTTPKSGQLVHFYGSVGYGSGPITLTWDFGDDTSPALGQNVVHSYTSQLQLQYTVKLVVVGAPCPITRAVYTSTVLLAGNVPPSHFDYLPIVNNGYTATTSLASSQVSSLRVAVSPLAASLQITNLVGSDLPGGSVSLAWSSPGAAVSAYYVYRRQAGLPGPFDSLATLPSTVTGFEDNSGLCGQVYYVAAVVGQVEYPSTAAYYNAPCTRSIR